MKVIAVPSTDLAEYAGLPEPCRREISAMLRAMSEICKAPRGKIERTIAAEAAKVSLSASRLRNIWDEFKNNHFDWHILINRSKYPDNARDLSEADIELFRKFDERNQRKTKPAHREFIRAWRRGEVVTSTPVDPQTGMPRGWSYRNLKRYQSSKFEIVAMRQGLGAAIAQHMGKVLRTRVGLWVGSHYVPDDVKRDFEVMLLQGVAGKKACIAELGVLDLYSAHRFTVHRRPEFVTDEGKKDKIKEREMRFVVAAVMRNIGYSPRGTQWLTELGTAAIRNPLATWLHEHSGGLVTVQDAGIRGRKQALAELAGRGGGNPAHKSWLESHHNLLHNEAGHLPAQTGHDRNPPEWLYGIERETEAVFKLINALPPEKAAMVRSRMMEYWQALPILAEIDRVISERVDHNLEGWEECGHTTIEYRADLTRDEWITQEQFLALPSPIQQTISALCEVTPAGVVARPRKLAPIEVWQRGADQLIRMPDHVIAMLFANRDLGDDLRQPRRLNDESEFVITDKTMHPSPLYFRGIVTTPAGERLPLDGRSTHAVVLNPFDLDALWIYDANGGFIGTADRKRRASLVEPELIIPHLGQHSADIARLTAPLKERHADMAETIREIQQNNEDLARGVAVTDEEKATKRKEARTVATIARRTVEGDITEFLRTDGETSAPLHSAEEITDILKD